MTPKHHYSRYLISVQFDRGFVPDTLDGKIEQVICFLDDLGKLARKNGKRLYASYSVVSGKNGYHAHFGVSWLPISKGYMKPLKSGQKRIARHAVQSLLEDNFFFVDNPKQAIKTITHDKKYVTNYVIYQPKEMQSAEFSDFYIHPDFVPTASEIKMQSYCSSSQFGVFKINRKNELKSIHKMLILISIIELFLISLILLSRF